MADVTVKNVDDEVMAKLARRAEAEGLSVQELARRALARAAAIPDLDDQLAQLRSARTPMSWDEFMEWRRARR
jgi:plasmid stability protein